LVVPVAKCVAVNLHLATIIRGEHELNRVVFRYVDEACHVDHEQVACAVFV
jgi:hypothetical protein